MIFLGLASLISGMITAITSWLPKVSSLPYNVDVYIAQGVGYYNFLAFYFPPLATIMTAFLVYFSFRILMLLLHLFHIIR